MSKLSEEVVSLLGEIFPGMKIQKEEYVLHQGQKLFIDIWVPQLDIVVEVHGRQHDEFVEHFHGNADGFRAYRKRDRLKEEWVALNGYTFVVIRESDFPLTKERLVEIIDAATRRDE